MYRAALSSMSKVAAMIVILAASAVTPAHAMPASFTAPAFLDDPADPATPDCGAGAADAVCPPNNDPGPPPDAAPPPPRLDVPRPHMRVPIQQPPLIIPQPNGPPLIIPQAPIYISR